MNFWEKQLNNLANHLYGFGTKTDKPHPNFKGIVAHRGAHDKATENTMAAFQRAVDHNVWGIELDVRWTRDNQPVVHHDEDLGRCFGRPDLHIGSMDLANLKREVPKLTGLHEVVDRFGGQTHLMIELKEDLDAQRNARLGELLSDLEPVSDFHLMSLDASTLKTVKAFPPTCFLPVAWYDTQEKLVEALENSWGGLAGHFVLLNPKIRAQLNAHNLNYGTGFISTKSSLIKELSLGVSWVFSDNPIDLQSYLQAHLTKA